MDNPKRKMQVQTISSKITEEERKINFEDALEMTGIGRFNYTLCAICMFINIVVITEMFGTSYIVASGGCDLELTTTTKGLVAAMPMLGIVLSAHLWGWLADTRGRRYVLLISMWGSFIFGFVSSFSINWVMLAVTKFAAAFFVSASVAVSFSLLGECTPISKRNQFILLISTGSLAAEGFMTLNAYPVLYFTFDVELLPNFHYKPWRLLLQLYAFWSLICAVLIIWFTIESPKFYASQGHEKKSIKVLSEIYHANNRKSSSNFKVNSLFLEESTITFAKDKNFLISMWEQTVPLFKTNYLFKTLLLMYLFTVINFVSPSFLMWLPTIGNIYGKALAEGSTGITICTMFQNQDGGNVTIQTSTCDEELRPISFVAMFIVAIMYTILNLIIYYAMKYVSKKVLCIIIHIIGAVCGFSLPWIPNINIGIAIFMLFQINLICYGLVAGFAVEFYPTHLRAMALCLMLMISRGISFVGITYIGILMEQYCEITINCLGAILISGALACLLLPSDKRDKDSNVT